MNTSRKTRPTGKRLAGLLAVLVCVFAAALFSAQVAYAEPTPDTVVDADTTNAWRNITEGETVSTQNIGRIWTDKSVFNDDYTPTGAASDTISKGDSDFLVALSALSSTSNLKTTTTTTTPLDIVLVLDQSGSMGDNFGGPGSGSRRAALQRAAENFINATEQSNQGLDQSQQHRISIVTFDSGSDVARGWTYVSGNGANQLRTTVDGLSAGGATRVDLGMDEANDQLSSARQGATKIVIVFTDGDPTSGSSFENEVAADAINTAHTIKQDKGATVYTIGIFSGANPSTDNKANNYMNAMSSNYPTATADGYNGGWFGSGAYFDITWGDGSRGDGFYKSATNSDELDNVFKEISDEITTKPGSPIEEVITEGGANTPGVLTFTDYLGDYMHVSGNTMTLMFADTPYTANPNADGTSWTLPDQVITTNGAYPDGGNLSTIGISVSKGTGSTGDTVTVTIPASLIPMRNYFVDSDTNEMTVSPTYPIRLFYGVSLDHDAVDAVLADPTSDEYKAFVEKYGNGTADAAATSVDFISNKWSGDEYLGDTTATFTPSSSNRFYYFTASTPVYTDQDCNNRAAEQDVESGAPLYYADTYWVQSGNSGSEVTTGVEVGSAERAAIRYSRGEAYIPAKTQHTEKITGLYTAKVGNETKTAGDVLNPTWGSATLVSQRLGNNGKISVELPSTLTVSKTVAVPAGFDKADLKDPSFSFNIHVEGVTGDYKADVMMKDGTSTDPFPITFDENGDATHSIKDGETLNIYGLPADAEYTVTEQNLPAYFENTIKTDDTGTLAAGATAAAAFTNTYKVTTPGTVTGSTSLKGEKILTPRPWQDGDSFTFTITNTEKPTSVETAPMPAETTVTVDDTDAQGADGTPVAFNFGDIEFDVPGTYKYTISEVIPATDAAERVPGVTYSLAQYEVTVEVVDNGEGVLTATPSMVQTQLDNGTNPETATAAAVAKFTNTYNADALGFGPRGTKVYTDNSGANPLTEGMFHFQITAKDGAPLPDGAQNGKLVVQNNADGSIAFEQVEFTAAMVGDTYEYEIVEVVDVDGQWVPVADAITPNADGAYVQDGMTYDASAQTLTLTVSSNADGTIVVTPTYSNGQEGFVFTNSYTPSGLELTEDGNSSIAGTKTLTGRDWKDGESFGFTLTLTSNNADGITEGLDQNGTATATVVGGTEGKASSFLFPDMTIAKPGVYTFSVAETSHNGDALPADGTEGMYYDRASYTVTIDVKDVDGKLEGTPVYTRNGETTTSAAFTNVYDADDVTTGEGALSNLQVTKKVTGNSTAAAFDFKLTLESGNAANVLTKADDPNSAFPTEGISKSTEAGFTDGQEKTVDFGSLTFTAEGDYTFQVVETTQTPNPANGWKYDNDARTITIHVTDEGGKLVAAYDEANPNNPTVTNVYDAGDVTTGGEGTISNLQVTKKVAGNSTDAVFEFALTLESGNAANVLTKADDPASAFPATGITKSTSGTIADGATQTVDFGSLTFTAEGDYNFQVVETTQTPDPANGWAYDNKPHTITVHVDDVDGQLVASYDATNRNNPTVTNVYDADDVTIGGDDGQAGITVAKTLEGRDWETKDSFEFTLAATTDGAPMPKSDTVTITSSTSNHTASFGAITYTKDMLDGAMKKDFKYTVTEVHHGDEIDGVSYATDPVTVTVTVTDPGDGKLQATVDYGEATSAAFTNTYSADPTDATVPANFKFTKVFKNHEWTEDYSFQFKLTAVDGAPMPKADEAAGVTIAEDGAALKTVSGPQATGEATFDFGPITYDKAGTYKYTVSEVEGTNLGVVYSKQVAEVTVTVTDKAEGVSTGKLVASAEVTNGTFENDYKTGSVDYDAAAGLQIVKNMTGRAIAAGDFEFTMTGNDDASVARLNGGKPMSFSTSGAALNGNEATETITALTGLTFTLDDAGKTYTYTVAETNGGKTIDGVTYDGTTYEVAFKVTDGGEGTLSVETLVDGVSQGVVQAGIATNALPAQLVFDNSYTTNPVIIGGGEDADVTLTGTKELANRPLENGEFTFNVTDAKGNLVMSGTNTADGTIVFGNVTYDVEKLNNDVAAGIATRTAGEGKAATYTYQYTVAEDQSGFEAAGVTGVVTSVDVTVTVTDNGAGELSASVSYPEGGMVLENIYGNGENGEFVSSLNGSKVLDVKSGDNAPSIEGKYTFTVTVPEGAPAPERTTAVNDASGNVDFGQILFTMENVFGDTGDEVEAPAEDVEGTEGVEGAEGDATLEGENDADAAAEADAIETLSATRTKTFTYTVTESGNVAGVDNDPVATREITYTVTDNGDGTLDVDKTVAAGAAAGKDFTYTNSYSVDPEPSSLTADGGFTIGKEIVSNTGRKVADGEFTFQLVNAEGEVVAEATNDANGNVSFKDVTFDAPGTYAYQLVEVKGDAANMDYDQTIYNVTATVTDDGDGTMTVAWAMPEATEGAVTFTNTYEADPTSVSLSAGKQLAGRDQVEGEFSFELREGDEVIATATNDAAGTVSFGTINYDEAGEHDYTITEVKGNAGGVTYDETVFTVHVSVTDNPKTGALSAKVTYGDNGQPTFENVYKPAPSNEITFGATKTLNGRDLTDGEFTFELKDASGKVVSTAKNRADGSVVFADAQSFTAAGTYTFTISEVLPEDDDAKTDGVQKDRVTYDEKTYTATVTVTDDLKGQLHATVSYGEGAELPSFVNTYVAPPLVPDTGDHTSAVLPAVLGLGGVAAVAGAILYAKRREN